MSNENTSVTTPQKVPAHIGLKRLEGSHYVAECTRCRWIGSSAELTKDAQCTRIEDGRMCLGDTDEVGSGRLLGILQALSHPAGQNRDEAVPAKVVAYTPGIAQVELQLSSTLPQWLELGEQVVIFAHAAAGEVGRLREDLRVEKARGELLNDARIQAEEQQWAVKRKLAERNVLLSRVLDHLKAGKPGEAQVAIYNALSASAEANTVEDVVRDERDYAIEHAGFLADAADQVMADYQAYALAQMMKSEGGDDGDGELENAVDSARDELHEGLANLRSMTHEFRKRRSRASEEPVAPTDLDPRECRKCGSLTADACKAGGCWFERDASAKACSQGSPAGEVQP